MGWWDGKIRLFNLNNRLLYRGLLLDLVAFAKERQYPISIGDPVLLESLKPTETTDEQIQEFIDSLGLPHTPHDFQFNALKSTIKQRRRTIKSATGSGKSLIVYMSVRYFDLNNKNVLVIVPTIGLVNQLWANFEEFAAGTSWNVESKGHKIYGGETKESEKQFTISTWQSLAGLPRSFYSKFDAIIVDECHGAAAKVLKEVLENCHNAQHRIGLTGTLSGFLANEMLIKGLLGPIIEVSNTRDLIDRGLLADLFIHCIVLKYPQHIRENAKKLDYQQETDFVISYGPRNRLLCNMANKLSGNTLVLVNRIEHGQWMYDYLQAKSTKTLHFIHGEVDPTERELIRVQTEKSDNTIIIATYGTFQLGINIVNLNNIILAHPSKSKIRVLQSIGRVLRVGIDKLKAKVFDITDDLRLKKRKNYGILHLEERIALFNSEGLSYDLKEVDLD